MIYSLLSLLAAISLVKGAVDQIGVNYDADASKMVVTFASSEKKAPTSAEVRYGTDPSNLTMTASASGITYSKRSYDSPMLYKATLDNIETGNKVYYYTVGSDALGYSEVMTFNSHPGVGVEDVTFYLVGDLGQTTNTETTLDELAQVAAMTSTPSGGIVSMGDISYANGDEPLWDSFGNLRQQYISNIPFMTTLGNHEWEDDASHDFIAYISRFNNPPVDGQEQLYYSYDAGLVHWVMVAGYCEEMRSPTTQSCLAEGSPQMAWLQKDLASVDRAQTPWVFVVFHQPYVNSNTAHSMNGAGEIMLSAC
jgi:acid phosphatase type 7